MNTSTETPPDQGRSKLSRATDWAMYIGIAGLFGVLVTRGASGPREGSTAKSFQLPLATGSGTFRLDEQRGQNRVDGSVRQLVRRLRARSAHG